jgi:hypothetical protein
MRERELEGFIHWRLIAPPLIGLINLSYHEHHILNIYEPTNDQIWIPLPLSFISSFDGG